MYCPDNIYENFRFMITEVTSIVENTLKYLLDPSPDIARSVRSRDNYVDTLKSLIEDHCHECLISDQVTAKTEANYLRSVTTISANLERIADFAINILRQMGHLADPDYLDNFDYHIFFKEVLRSLVVIDRALEKSDLGLAMQICRSEFKLDALYKAQFALILDRLAKGGPPENLVTSLFIFHYLERMGDSLLNIGEAIIFALVGERMKIHQYRALQRGLVDTGISSSVEDVELSSIWGTRSGCRIGTATDTSESGQAVAVLFKQGTRSKLEQERDNIDLWQSLAPGVPPKVWGFHNVDADNASVLLEYLPGRNMQEILLGGDADLLLAGLTNTLSLMSRVWQETRRPGPVSADFVGQIVNRQNEVFRMHPQFRLQSCSIGAYTRPSLQVMLRELVNVESEFPAPYSVLIHGDFNLNNILYDADAGQVHLIDLHRSKRSDYVQDASVFIVSSFRLPVFDTDIRIRINEVIAHFHQFVSDMAAESGDATFQARLALGLARSLFSSTRFEYNQDFAKDMYLRSIYLLEKLVSHQGKPWDRFRLPFEELFKL